MLITMLIEMYDTKDELLAFTPDFKVFFVKLPCAYALHFALYPEVAKGLNMMKFANN